jgi:hypothetical protein
MRLASTHARAYRCRRHFLIMLTALLVTGVHATRWTACVSHLSLRACAREWTWNEEEEEEQIAFAPSRARRDICDKFCLISPTETLAV